MFGEQKPDEQKPAVRWLPFQLNPDLPEDGITRAQYLERKFGPGKTRDYSHVIEIGQSLGIRFAFDLIKVQPNTLKAHRLLQYGELHERQNEVAESLFSAYFEEGADLTNNAALVAAGVRAGLDGPSIESYLASDADKTAVMDADLEARRAGVNGVPFFIFNRRTAVSGAHEPETLLKALINSISAAAPVAATE
jgi:predicted DsbA family dithiol-disulfide isomerase